MPLGRNWSTSDYVDTSGAGRMTFYLSNLSHYCICSPIVLRIHGSLDKMNLTGVAKTNECNLAPSTALLDAWRLCFFYLLSITMYVQSWDVMDRWILMLKMLF